MSAVNHAVCWKASLFPTIKRTKRKDCHLVRYSLKSSLVPVMVWCLISDKPWPNFFTRSSAYLCIISLKLLNVHVIKYLSTLSTACPLQHMLPQTKWTASLNVGSKSCCLLKSIPFPDNQTHEKKGLSSGPIFIEKDAVLFVTGFPLSAWKFIIGIPIP